VHEGSDLLDGSIVLEEAVDIEGDDRFEGVIVEPIFTDCPVAHGYRAVSENQRVDGRK
jgi:hypothetical protein